MSQLLQKKEEHEKQCETCVRGEDFSRARVHALKAADLAFQLAKATLDTAGIAQKHIEDGEAWIEIAEKLQQSLKEGKQKGNPKTKIETSRGKKGKVADEPDGDTESAWEAESRPNITFDQIAGMHEAKETIMEMVVYPLQHADKARALGLNAGGGVLLYGPPGNGKTLLGKAIAGEIDAPFFYASGAQLRSKWHGESEQRLREIIRTAKAEKVAVLFFDEIDGLLPKRGGNSAVDNRMVTQFLSEIGGFEGSDNTLLLLGATNKPWDIDEAVFRTGRFDEKIYIPPPDRDAREGIFEISFGDVAIEDGIDFVEWADRLNGYTGSDISGIVMGAKRGALRRCIQSGEEPIVTMIDLEAALSTIPASINPKMIAQYERFREYGVK